MKKIILPISFILVCAACAYGQDANEYKEIARIKGLDGDYKEAIMYINKAIEINPYDTDLFVWGAALIAVHEEDHKGSIKYIDKAIEVNPKDANIYFHRARINRRFENYSGAAEDANKAIELDPENLEFYVLRGWMRYKMGNIGEACEDMMLAMINDKRAREIVLEHCMPVPLE